MGGKAIRICEGFHVDSEHEGGLGQFINHGFPNCAFYYHSYRGLPLVAIVALDDLPADARLFLSYGANYFANLKLTPETLNPSAIQTYLGKTNGLKKIPFIEFAPDGKSYVRCDRGKMEMKTTAVAATEDQALEGWSNKIKLEYLAHYHAVEMREKLDRLPYKWLIEQFKK